MDSVQLNKCYSTVPLFHNALDMKVKNIQCDVHGSKNYKLFILLVVEI